jgi:3-hydroxyacyl-[acyl-carrier-protein] dehydratase
VRYLLVDRIESIDGDRAAVGWKNVAMSEDYLEWHFPGKPVVPGTLVLEAFVQLAGWLEASASSCERWVLLDRVVSARYAGISVPGDRLELRLERVGGADPARRAYRGESVVGGERRATVEFEAVVVPVESLDDRATIARDLATLRGGGGPRGRRPT